jgi:BirA family transcriptional regulator, biotin operon repressor / biotin---[acetyl-CoA-carboxylase] ligase
VIASDLSRAEARVRERGGRLGVPMHLLAETASTNDDAKEGAKQGAPHGAVWIAESQTAGRGRHGRAWTSSRNENLLFSVLLRLVCPPPRVPLVALAAGLAVRDAVARAIGDDRPQVKWPNDVLVDEKKVAGILVESALAGDRTSHVVVGVGVNVHTRSFPAELEAIATSVALAAPGVAADRAEILADILGGLDHDVEHVVHRGLGLASARLARHDALLGHEVLAEGGLRGVASGIDPDGRLLLRDADGILHHIVSGEVRRSF